MRYESAPNNQANRVIGLNLPRTTIIGLFLVIALFAFEIFNFDTTRYALQNLLGDVSFWGLRWATILAIAFCAIDFAGLARLFTPEQGREEPNAVWYLMGAWLLGATMNALMTWWAVSLTLLSHDFGNEVMSRDQLLQVVPIFVAALVWLTRILFIGALSVAGEYLFDFAGLRQNARPHAPTGAKPAVSGLKLRRQSETAVPRPQPQRQPPNNRQRIRHRPPMPRPTPTPAGMHAQSPKRDR
ncbi:MAG: hypothetical protein GY803_09535 [Chloroflexi bacterium]|nr:hypothetical protein [Chloroflexota bacterium]